MERSGVQGPAAIGERRARAASGDPISKSIMSRPCITKIFGVVRIVLFTLIILMAGYVIVGNVMVQTFGVDIYFYGLGLFVIVNVSMYLCFNYVRCHFAVDSTVDGDVKSPLLAVAHHPPPHPIAGVAVQAGGGNRNQISKSIMSRPCITKIFGVTEIFGVAWIVLSTLIILMAGYAIAADVVVRKFGLDIYFCGLGLFVIVNISIYLFLNYVRCRLGVSDSTVDEDVKSPLLAVAHHPPLHPIAGVAVQVDGDLQDREKRKEPLLGVGDDGDIV